jgi:integrase
MAKKLLTERVVLPTPRPATWEEAQDFDEAKYHRGRGLIAQHNLDPHHHYEFHELCQRLGSETEVEAYCFAWDYDHPRKAPMVDSPIAAPAQPQRPTPSGAGENMFDVLQRYANTRTKTVRAGTVESYTAKCRLFLRNIEHALGRPPRVGDVTPEHVRGYCDFLNKATKRLPTDRPLTDDDVKMAGNPMSAKNRFVHAIAVEAFLEWLADQQYGIADGLAQIVRTEFPKPPSNWIESSSFDDAEICTLFSADDYRLGQFKRASDYWVPLLAAYSGGTAAELLQLTCDDVRCDGTIWVIEVTDADNKQVKNIYRRRRIPLHPDLFTLGFLDFVDGIKEAGGARLFPDEVRSRSKDYFGAFSKRFNWRRKRLSIASDRTKRKRDFQSFRHAFIGKLKQQGVPLYQIKALVGHSPKELGMAAAVYAQEPLNAETLHDAVAMVTYGIDITTIAPNGFKGFGARVGSAAANEGKCREAI